MSEKPRNYRLPEFYQEWPLEKQEAFLQHLDSLVSNLLRIELQGENITDFHDVYHMRAVEAYFSLKEMLTYLEFQSIINELLGGLSIRIFPLSESEWKERSGKDGSPISKHVMLPVLRALENVQKIKREKRIAEAKQSFWQRMFNIVKRK